MTGPAQEAVVLLDDSEDMVEILSAVLALEGYVVAPFVAPEAMLERLATGLQPCVLLVDYTLRDRTALEVLANVRALGVGAPAVLLTGMSPATLDPEQLRDLGVQRSLTKPITVEALLQVIDEIGGNRAA